MKCPICGKRMKTHEVDYINGALAEENNKCPEGHYAYEFHYGETIWKIGDEFLTYHFTQSEEEYRQVKKKIDKLIKHYRGNRKIKRLK